MLEQESPYQKGEVSIWDLMDLPGGFPGSSVVKNSLYKAGDTGSIPGWGRSPAEGNGNPLQYPCLGSPVNRGAWWATAHGITKS